MTRMRYAGAVLVALALSGCTQHPSPPPPPDLSWQEISLPGNAFGRPEVRDVTACPGHWYAAGGYRAPDGTTTPALWSTVDGRRWRSVPTQPKSIYGPQHRFSAVACRGDTVVTIGSAPGGVHGNLRTNTWIGAAGGTLTEIPAAFELFGGPRQIGVGQLVAGDRGWLLGGARTDANGEAGAAVWTATDGAAFRLIDADPALESDARGETVLTGVTALPGKGFVAVGSMVPTGNPVARQPLAWRSPDGGHWTRETVPHDAEDADIEAVVPRGDGLLALGIRGNSFGAWLGSATGWRPVTRFGTLGGSALAQITGLVALGGTAYAVGSDGTRYRLWRATDPSSWTELPMPAAVPAGGPAMARLATLDGQLLLATDGIDSHLWLASVG